MTAKQQQQAQQAARAKKKSTQPDGVLVVDKPRGPTSHDVVARVRKALKTRHIGHTGTLDPMATGVLVLAIGEATKLVPWLTAADKAYEATIRLGVATNTLDSEGEVLETVPVPEHVVRAIVDRSSLLEEAITAERTRTMQVPPAYSAIRIDGVRAHELARAGRLDAESLPARPVEVRAIEVTGGGGVTENGAIVELHIRVEASKGYFVRSLARDLAIGLGTVGHLTSLRRTQSGAFTIADATTLDDVVVQAQQTQQTGEDQSSPSSSVRLLTVSEAAARALPVTILDAAGVRAVSFGRQVSSEQMTDPHPCPSAWLDESRRLVAIGVAAGGDGAWVGRVLRGFLAGQPQPDQSANGERANSK